MKTTIVVAISRNNVIGKDRDLPWHYPQDLRFFKRTTMGHPVVMGRKTFETLRRPLPGRQNIVLTRNPGYRAPPEVLVCPTLAAAREHCERAGAEQMCIIGGAEIYRLALPETDEMIITRIPEEVVGDTWFPEWNPAEWEAADRREDEGLCYLTYQRK